MKIYAFEVRNDEINYFDELAEKYSLEIELSSETLTLEMIPNLKEDSAVSILGLHKYGKDELDALAAKNIRYLSTRTIGYNHVDIAYAKEIGIHVCNASYPPNGVADYTVMMILLCLRNYKQALWRTNVNDYSLEGLIGRDLKDLKVGIMGTGKIGSTVARNLSGFGCQILAYDTYHNSDIEDFVTYVELEQIYRQCDVITLHMPLLDSTHHIINERSIAKMKDGVVLINCARGGLMDIDALIENVESEKIGALGLDCMEDEEAIVHKDRRTDIFSNRKMAYLRQFKNVVHTQHMAFYTTSAVKSMVHAGVCGLLQMKEQKPCSTQLA